MSQEKETFILHAGKGAADIDILKYIGKGLNLLGKDKIENTAYQIQVTAL